MSGIALFCENLGAFSATRAKTLHARMRAEGLKGIDCVFALVWPDYAPPDHPRPQENRAALKAWRSSSGLPVWGWYGPARLEKQEEAGTKIRELSKQLGLDGVLLNIEGEWTKTAKLTTLAQTAKATELPIVASLAGFSPSGTSYDYRSLDLAGAAIDWQAYFDSGEGPTPALAVRELYRASWVVSGWEYRHRLGSVYGWGKIADTAAGQIARFDSYKRPGAPDAELVVSPRVVNGSAFGYDVIDGKLRRSGIEVGLLMGRAAYAQIRVTLDVTRSAQGRPPHEWEAIAASARAQGSRKRPISVYLAENATDDVLLAIARGAAW